MVRRVVGARVKDPHAVDDLVQETLARVVAARSRIEADSLPQYAAVTARNLVASMATRSIRARERSHLLVDDPEDEDAPVADVLLREERHIVMTALAKLPDADRLLLLAHEVEGQDTATIASGNGSTPGAVAARLFRARANLRVEYLFAAEQLEPPTDRCRPVLRAISSADRRRQQDLDAAGHLLRCTTCARLRALLGARRGEQDEEGVVRVPVARDADVVLARQKAREVAAEVGFSATDMTLVATAISEVTRNIVKFAERGEVVLTLIRHEHRQGIHVVARDVGPGIEDPEEAMRDGFSTCQGFGLGLPGAKRLMDHFELTSNAGEGTTVTMEKWLP
ncbi:serine/threonine protein kinase [Nocardioides gansuensis]|uniref:Serine/threonine protein kinase n=2 Tax=Nocardioides gansuensis TaxID=2138300 RepID=A0A2T8FGL7_9ACTN|nr:serine/threonine protein kinase [Nocardioides gansuensis]